MTIVGRTVERLRRTSMWNILWISLILSEILTAMMNTLMGYVWWGEVSLDLILIGTVDAFFVAGIVTVIVLFLIQECNRVEREAEENTRKVAALHEREEVSRWLHDNLGSDLFNISLLTDTIRQKQVEGREAEEYIDRITDVSRNALNSIRSYLNFSEQVGPAVKDLVGYMRDYGRGLFGESEVGFTFEADLAEENFPLLPMKSFSVYMIYKEALAGIFARARARRVDVRLAGESGKLSLTIVEDGGDSPAGGEGAGRYSGGNISSRARMIGGEVRIESRPGEGTNLHLTVPV